MSDMKPKNTKIILGGKEYGLRFTLNAIDDVQEHLDMPISQLPTILNDEMKRIKGLRYLLTVLINEAIDCEIDEGGENRPHVEERFVGRQINADNVNSLVSAVYASFSGATPDSGEDDPNPPSA